MFSRLSKKSALLVGTGLALGLLAGVGMTIGILATLGQRQTNQLILPETALHAVSSTRAETLAAATGPVDDDMEGLFTLDFLTGDLQCFVMYSKGPGAQKFGGYFKTNVIPALQGADALKAPEKGKKPSYLLLTGQSRFVRGGGMLRPGYSVAYVIDANTGRFAAYGIRWSPTQAASGRPQKDELVLLDVGVARTAAIREP